MANNKLVNQLVAYTNKTVNKNDINSCVILDDEESVEMEIGLPIDERSVVERESDIIDIEHAYPGMIVSPTLDNYIYKVTKIDKDSKPVRWVKNGINEEDVARIASSISTNQITQAFNDATSQNGVIQEQLDDVKDEVNTIIQNTIDSELVTLQDRLHEIENRLTSAREDIANAQALLESLTDSTGNAQIDIDEVIGRISASSWYADVEAQTLATCLREMDAQKAEILDEVKKIDVTGETVTAVREYLSGEGRHLIDASITDAANNAVTAATRDINVALGYMADTIYAGNTGGSLTSIEDIKSLCVNGQPRLEQTVSELTNDNTLSLSQISQTTDSLSSLVTKSTADGKTIAASIVSLINEDNSEIRLDADKITINGDTIVRTLSSTTVTVGSGSCVFNEDGSGILGNGSIIWDYQGNLATAGDKSNIGLSYQDMYLYTSLLYNNTEYSAVMQYVNPVNSHFYVGMHPSVTENQNDVVPCFIELSHPLLNDTITFVIANHYSTSAYLYIDYCGESVDWRGYVWQNNEVKLLGTTPSTSHMFKIGANSLQTITFVKSYDTINNKRQVYAYSTSNSVYLDSTADNLDFSDWISTTPTIARRAQDPLLDGTYYIHSVSYNQEELDNTPLYIHNAYTLTITNGNEVTITLPKNKTLVGDYNSGNETITLTNYSTIYPTLSEYDKKIAEALNTVDRISVSPNKPTQIVLQSNNDHYITLSYFN